MRWVALAIVLAAIPTTVLADSTVDLSTILAPPPATDYVEGSSSATILDGPFTAQQYADFLNAFGADGSAALRSFTLDGFTRGYARTWAERGTQRVLIERVFELSSGSGAQSLFSQNKLGTQTGKTYKGDIDTSSVPDSFGGKADEGGGAFHDYFAAFVKGNDFYNVLMGSSSEDLTSELQAQVRSAYRVAPDLTIPKSQWTSGTVTINGSIPSGLVTGAVIIGIVMLVLVAGAALLVVILVRRQSRAQPVPVGFGLPPIGVDMSPDGAFWWDGQRWRDASIDAPAAAPRSPDGAYWWDGRTWRPLPTTRPSG